MFLSKSVYHGVYYCKVELIYVFHFSFPSPSSNVRRLVTLFLRQRLPSPCLRKWFAKLSIMKNTVFFFLFFQVE